MRVAMILQRQLNGKRTAAIKSRAEAACRLCRDGAVKSPRSGIKAESGKLSFNFAFCILHFELYVA